MSRAVALVVFALVAAAAAQCTYQNANLKISKVADPPSIACAATAAQFLAPLYSSFPMIRMTSGNQFRVAIFNQTQYDNYVGGVSGSCVNQQNCTRVITAAVGFYNSTLQWPYADTFYFVPICDDPQICTFEVYIRMDAPAPVGGSGTPTEPPSSAAAFAPCVLLVAALISMLLHGF